MTPRKPQIVYLETQPDGRVFEGVPANTIDKLYLCDGCCKNHYCGEFLCIKGKNPLDTFIIYKPTGFREPKR